MPYCEDYPCCGHSDGDCPDSEGNFGCARCGTKLPKDSKSSMCYDCLGEMHRVMDEDSTGQDLDCWIGDSD